jgi:hypothetical protein
VLLGLELLVEVLLELFLGARREDSGAPELVRDEQQNQQPERDEGATEARDCPSHPPILPARGGSLNARGGS